MQLLASLPDRQGLRPASRFRRQHPRRLRCAALIIPRPLLLPMLGEAGERVGAKLVFAPVSSVGAKLVFAPVPWFSPLSAVLGVGPSVGGERRVRGHVTLITRRSCGAAHDPGYHAGGALAISA